MGYCERRTLFFCQRKTSAHGILDLYQMVSATFTRLLDCAHPLPISMKMDLLRQTTSHG